MPSPLSVANSPLSCPLLDSTHSDAALRGALLWTRASDHLPLRLTCRRFREILDSSAFRRQRCESGFSEVQAILAPQRQDEYMVEEEYREKFDEIGYVDGELGYRSNTAHLIVDGKQAGTASFVLLPRKQLRENFHSMADAVSGDLLTAATTFFDGRGRPRLPSLQQAIAHSDNQKGFLYLSTFHLNDPVYRTTWTGAMALRSLLTETPLTDQWSVAAYIPEAKAQCSEEDVFANQQYRAEGMEQAHAQMMGIEIVLDDDQKEKEKEWLARHHALTKLDMLQFLRAGFRQVHEGIQESTCFFLYALPHHLHPPLLSHEETMAIPIVEKSAERQTQNEPITGDALRLVEMMKGFCTQRQSLVNLLLEAQRQSLESPAAGGAVNHLHPQPQATNQSLVARIRARDEQMNRARCEANIRALDAQVQSETAAFVRQAGSAIVESSDVLHVCAYHLEPLYFRMLVSLIPHAEQQQSAINAFGRNGLTPLMAAARSGMYNQTTIGNRFTTCQALMDWGADKNLVDSSGLTALGGYRKNYRDLCDFYACMGGVAGFNGNAELGARPGMEALLKPLRGPTVADDAVLEVANDEDVDWEAEYDEEHGDY